MEEEVLITKTQGRSTIALNNSATIEMVYVSWNDANTHQLKLQ